MLSGSAKWKDQSKQWSDALYNQTTLLDSSKGKGLDTCYSATYMSQPRDQQRFTIS